MDHRYNMLIPAGLFIGIGVGIAVGNVPAGLFIGLGAGFLISTLIHMISNKKS